MSSNEKQIKEQLIREQLEKEQRAKEIELLNAEEERRKAAIQLDESDTEAKPEPEVYKLSKKHSSDWNKIIEDYKKQYPDKPIKNNCLCFESDDDAVNFFQAQATAQPPRAFFAIKVDEHGTPLGPCMCSCGNGKLYQGNASEIKAQLEQELEKDPNNPEIMKYISIAEDLLKKPAQDFRSTMQAQREEHNNRNSSEPSPEDLSPTPP